MFASCRVVGHPTRIRGRDDINEEGKEGPMNWLDSPSEEYRRSPKPTFREAYRSTGRIRCPGPKGAAAFAGGDRPHTHPCRSLFSPCRLLTCDAPFSHPAGRPRTGAARRRPSHGCADHWSYALPNSTKAPECRTADTGGVDALHLGPRMHRRPQPLRWRSRDRSVRRCLRWFSMRFQPLRLSGARFSSVGYRN